MLFSFNLLASTIILHVVGLGLPIIALNDYIGNRKFHGAQYRYRFNDNFKKPVSQNPSPSKSNDEVIFDLVKVKESLIEGNFVHEIERNELEKEKSEEALEPYYFVDRGYDQLVGIRSHGLTRRKMPSARDYGRGIRNRRYNGEGSGDEGSGAEGSGGEDYTKEKEPETETGQKGSLLEKFKKDWLKIKAKLKPIENWTWLGSGFYTMMNELGIFARKVSPIKLPCVIFC